MLQRNLLYTGVHAASGWSCWLDRRRPSPSRCATSRAAALVEAAGTVEYGRLEALCECMMSGITAPPWRSCALIGWGATHFLMKTLPRVASEMALHGLAYNLTRVMNIIGIQPLITAMRA